MYKITFNLISPMAFIDLPLFDGILAYLFFREKYGKLDHNFHGNYDDKYDLDLFPDFPLKKDEKGLYLASFMQYEKEIEFTGSWKKRWANKYDFIADFGKNKRQVEIDKGSFKSYDMPLNLHSINKVWFFFDTDNLEYVEKLVSNLFGIGKKTAQGNGEIKDFIIEKLDYNPFNRGVFRPIPLKLLNISENEKTKLILNGDIAMSRIKPPYWSVKELEACIIK